MKSNIITALTVATLLVACTTPMDLKKRISFLGDPASEAAAGRTVVISPTTSAVTITGGEVIRFVCNGKSFSWNFDGAGAYNFDLELVAPVGVLDHPVRAYVNPDPFYNGGK